MDEHCQMSIWLQKDMDLEAARHAAHDSPLLASVAEDEVEALYKQQPAASVPDAEVQAAKPSGLVPALPLGAVQQTASGNNVTGAATSGAASASAAASAMSSPRPWADDLEEDDEIVYCSPVEQDGDFDVLGNSGRAMSPCMSMHFCADWPRLLDNLCSGYSHLARCWSIVVAVLQCCTFCGSCHGCRAVVQCSICQS